MPKPKPFFKKQQKKGGGQEGAGKKKQKVRPKALFNAGQKQKRKMHPEEAAWIEQQKAHQQHQQGKQGGKAAVATPPASTGRAGARLLPKHAEGDALLDSFKQRLSGSTFRLLNEQLYTTPSPYAAQLLKDKSRFREYHDGYRHQLAMWPTNPNQLVIDALLGDRRGRFAQNKKQHVAGHIPPSWVIADMGCGEAGIAKAMLKAGHGHKVHSFDLCNEGNPLVTVSDIAHTPLDDASVDVTVFCLALMSTNWFDFLVEAHRILKDNKLLKVVEVRSRLPKPEQFVGLVEALGFTSTWWDTVDTHFIAFDFVKGVKVVEGRRRPEDDDDRETLGQKRRRQRDMIAATAAAASGEAEVGSSGPEPRYPPNEVLTPCLYRRR
jgi:hypothetical protein